MLNEDEINEAVEFAMISLAERLRDQAALKAEQGHDDVAELIRNVAERIELKI